MMTSLFFRLRARLGISFAAAFLLIALSGCGPDGPGALSVRVSGEALGGAVLEIDGRGIQGFEARGDSRVYSAPMPGRENVHRVIILHPSGGEIDFDIAVDDTGMDPPVVRVVSATRTDNSLMSVGGISFTLER